MNNTTKYLGLILLMIGVFFGFVLALAIVVLLFKVIFSIGLFDNVVSQGFYHYFIIIIPYLIFLGAFYYLYTKVLSAKNKTSKTIAALFLTIGCLVCVGAFILSTLAFLNIKNDWLTFFKENSGYSLTIQLVVVFITAATLGFGDPKEKDWMENNNNNNNS